MTREELMKIAERARRGESKWLAEFKEIAKEMGFESRRGGWIYLHGLPVVRGWWRLAVSIRSGQYGKMVRAYLGEPTPTARQDANGRKVVTMERTPPPAPASQPFGAEYVRRIRDSHETMRNVVTGGLPGSHIAPLQPGKGIGRLLCGALRGGAIKHLALEYVDCLGCLDAYAALMVGQPHPIEASDETRSRLVKP